MLGKARLDKLHKKVAAVRFVVFARIDGEEASAPHLPPRNGVKRQGVAGLAVDYEAE